MPCQAILAMADLRGIGDAAFASLLPWLGEAEQERCRRFGRAARRHQFIAGRVLARMLLGELLGAAPASLQLQERAGQGPCLAGPFHAAGLSISHSGPLVAVAVSADTALGLDIEWIDPGRDFGAIADHAFDGARSAVLAALPQAEQARAFYRMWSEHEARIKLGQDAACCIDLFHDEVSVVLCTAAPLDAPPALRQIFLPLAGPGTPA
jgi:4'-phosphopantetheinyl transferase